MVMEVLYLLVVWVASDLMQCYSDICCCFCAVHLWRYRGGYPALTDCLQKLRANKACCDLFKRLLFSQHCIQYIQGL